MDEVIRFAQRATISTLEKRDRDYRAANADDYRARAFDVLSDIQRPHDIAMELTVRLPKSLTDDERKRCELIVTKAWDDMFFGVMRETAPRPKTDGGAK